MKKNEKIYGQAKIKLYSSNCEGCPARSKAPDLRSGFEGIRGFESHPPHLIKVLHIYILYANALYVHKRFFKNCLD